ncbi:MAG: hypothetical protein JWN96_1846, partial [Mycobacterium sp.]|nr:hypothetical protein [Mycobacterium sp.]
MTIASFCRDQLFEQGPLTIEELTERVVAAGLTRSRSPLSTVQSAITHVEVKLADGRWASPLWLLQGRWLTTTGFWGDQVDWYPDPYDEIPDRRDAEADLDALVRLLRGGPLAVPGGQVKNSYSSSWKAPKGWPGLSPRAGQLLAYRVVGRSLEVEVIDETAEMRMRGLALSARIVAAE